MSNTLIMAGFLIWGDNLNPELVTGRLGVKPTISYSKGDDWGPKGRKRPFNSWRLDTEKEESDDVNKQFLKLYDLLKGKEDTLNDLRREYNLEYQLGIVISIENDQKPAIYFDRWLIEFAHTIDAQIVMDLYC